MATLLQIVRAWSRGIAQVFGRVLYACVCLSLLLLLSACTQDLPLTGPNELNSRYSDEQPALSGDGRFLAFVSNRDGHRGIFLYDLEQRHTVDLPHLNQQGAIAESPSLSYGGRYIVYLAGDTVRPEIKLYDRAIQQSQVLTAGYRAWFRRPSVSPDGRYIVFETGTRGQWDIEVMDRGSGIEPDLPDNRR